jgi:hypothetical protein
VHPARSTSACIFFMTVRAAAFGSREIVPVLGSESVTPETYKVLPTITAPLKAGPVLVIAPFARAPSTGKCVTVWAAADKAEPAIKATAIAVPRHIPRSIPGSPSFQQQMPH